MVLPRPVILGAEEPYHFYLLRLVSFCKESCPIGKLDVRERPATLFAPFSVRCRSVFSISYGLNRNLYTLPIEGFGYFLKADRVVLVALPFD